MLLVLSSLHSHPDSPVSTGVSNSWLTVAANSKLTSLVEQGSTDATVTSEERTSDKNLVRDSLEHERCADVLLAEDLAEEQLDPPVNSESALCENSTAARVGSGSGSPVPETPDPAPRGLSAAEFLQRVDSTLTERTTCSLLSDDSITERTERSRGQLGLDGNGKRKQKPHKLNQKGFLILRQYAERDGGGGCCVGSKEKKTGV